MEIFRHLIRSETTQDVLDAYEVRFALADRAYSSALQQFVKAAYAIEIHDDQINSSMENLASASKAIRDIAAENLVAKRSLLGIIPLPSRRVG